MVNKIYFIYELNQSTYMCYDGGCPDLRDVCALFLSLQAATTASNHELVLLDPPDPPDVVRLASPPCSLDLPVLRDSRATRSLRPCRGHRRPQQ